MNQKNSILLFLAMLGYLSGFSTILCMHAGREQQLDIMAAQRAAAAPGAPGAAGPTKEQAAQAVEEAEAKVIKAQRVAPGAGTASGAEALKLLEKLPAHGIGILTGVRNLTKYPISIQSSGAKTLHDQLPEGTIVRLKSLDPRFGTEGKYYTLRKGKEGEDFAFKPDTSDINDKSTYFIVKRRVSKDLTDWIGFTHPISDDKTLQVDPATLNVGFFNKSFNDEKDTQSHWSMLGKSLDNCTLRNRKTGGLLSYFSGEKEVKTTKVAPLTDTFGLEQAGFEIISALFGEEKGTQRIVTDVIKSMALKEGKIEIRGDLYDFFGIQRTTLSQDSKAVLTIRVRNGNKIENITAINGTSDNPTNFVYRMPAGAAQLGTMLQLQGKNWRGPVLEYNTIINISSAKYPAHILWTHQDNYEGNNSDLIVGDPADRHTYTGPQLFMIKSKAEPNKTGPINYNDEIEIWSLFASPKDFRNQDIKEAGTILNPARKWWVNFGSRLGGDYAEILIAGDDKDPRAKSSQGTFALVSPNKLTGAIHQNDIINIISKAQTTNGIDGKGAVFDKRYTDQRLWVNATTESRYGTDKRAEILLRDDWGPKNKFNDMITGEKNLTGDRSVMYGGFKIQSAFTNKLSKDIEKIYTNLGLKGVKRTPGKLMQISIKHSKEVWGVNVAQEAWKWNGATWIQIPSPNPLKQVAVNTAGEIWGVSVDNKIWQYINKTWAPLGGDAMKQIALRSGTEVWGISADDFVHVFNGSSWDKTSPEEGGIISISVSHGGQVWATDIKGRTWRLGKDKSWVAVNAPSDKAVLIQLAVRSDSDVWATADNGSVYHWNGKTWTKQTGRLSSVSVASGSKTVVLKAEKRFVEAGTTTDANNKPITSPTSALKVEIVQLGIGGNLPPNKTVEVNIPTTKSPQVSGFAATRIESFEPGAKLIVVPLLSKGAAWPENSFQVPGRAAVSFLAKPEDAGDIQVLFGPEISDNYTWKVVIGGWGNTKSAIIRRSIAGGQPRETTMYEITKKQNPLAYAPPGNFTPYWVSYDKGFIMVGMGLPGENVFMAQRVKEATGAAAITRVGFGSNKSNVEYTEIQFLPPIIIKRPERIYAQSKETITLGAQQAGFTWTRYPFRADDRGAVSFEIQGTDNVVLALGQKNSNDAAHYAIVFTSGKAGITIKKWIPEKKQYIDRAILPRATYPAIGLDPAKSIPIWVSFEEGRFAIGNGSIGENPLLVFQDLNDYDHIHTVGFGNLGSNPATITNLQASPPILIRLEGKEEAYKSASSWYQYRGAVTILMPFEYQFSQKDASVIATDMLSNEVFYSGATPGGGNLFKFLLKVNPDGFPELVWETEPENITQQKVKQAIVQTAAEAELQKAKADLEVKEGVRLHSLATAASKVEKTKGEAIQSIASTMTGAASAVAMAGGVDPTVSWTALGSSLGLGVAAIATSGIASKFLTDAAKIDFQGAKQEAAYRARGGELEAAANQLQFQSNLLTGNAQFAFKDPRSYVFVDSPERAALGAAGLPAEVLANAQKANDLITQAGLIKPTDQKNFELLLSFLQDVVFLVTHSFVVTDFLKQKFNLYVSDLYTAYNTLFIKKLDIRVTNDFINLLLTASNNGYLFNSAQDAEQKEAIYTWINKLAHNLLTKMPSISLKPCFGEYIWLPVPLPTPDRAVVELTVEGRHDVFVCFSQEPVQVRNTTKDIYEIVLAGWDNTKHAIRIQSLGRSVKEFTKEEYPDTMMNPYLAQTYKVSLDNGKITINVQGKDLTWTDPYPIKGIKWVGISNWDSEINFKKISLKPLKAAVAPAAAGEAETTAPEAAPEKVTPETPAEVTPTTPPTQSPEFTPSLGRGVRVKAAPGTE